jgi:cytoskeletal protein RodZ
MMVMKKHESQILPRELSQQKNRSKSRRKIHWLVRLLVALVLVSLAALSLLAYWSTFKSRDLSLPTRVYQASRQATNLKYQVVSVSRDQAGESLAGEGQVYVSALAQSVRPVFRYVLCRQILRIP